MVTGILKVSAVVSRCYRVGGAGSGSGARGVEAGGAAVGLGVLPHPAASASVKLLGVWHIRVVREPAPLVAHVLGTSRAPLAEASLMARMGYWEAGGFRSMRGTSGSGRR